MISSSKHRSSFQPIQTFETQASMLQGLSFNAVLFFACFACDWNHLKLSDVFRRDYINIAGAESFRWCCWLVPLGCSWCHCHLMPWLHACVASWACFHGFRPAGGKTSIQCWSEHQGEGSCESKAPRLAHQIAGLFTLFTAVTVSYNYVQLKLNFERSGSSICCPGWGCHLEIPFPFLFQRPFPFIRLWNMKPSFGLSFKLDQCLKSVNGSGEECDAESCGIAVERFRWGCCTGCCLNQSTSPPWQFPFGPCSNVLDEIGATTSTRAPNKKQCRKICRALRPQFC